MFSDNSHDQLLHSLQLLRARVSRLEGVAFGTLVLLAASSVLVSVQHLHGRRLLSWRRWLGLPADWRLQLVVPPEPVLVLFFLVLALVTQLMSTILLHGCSLAIDVALESAEQLPRAPLGPGPISRLWPTLVGLVLLLLVLVVLRLKHQWIAASTIDEVVSCLSRAAGVFRLLCCQEASSTCQPSPLQPSQQPRPPRDGTSPDSACPEQRLCVVCQDKERCVLLLPCRHLCLCISCSRLLHTDSCPVCRATVDEHLAVFV